VIEEDDDNQSIASKSAAGSALNVIKAAQNKAPTAQQNSDSDAENDPEAVENRLWEEDYARALRRDETAYPEKFWKEKSLRLK
jgi:hypothetical protein